MVMRNIYSCDERSSEQKKKFKGYVERVFQNHYFSNHWELAISLESELSKVTEKKHNVTYMNGSVALISMLHILGLSSGGSVKISRDVALYPWVQDCLDYMEVNAHPIDGVDECENNDVLIALDIGLGSTAMMENNFSARIVIIPTQLSGHDSVRNDCIFIYDMGQETCFGMSTGAFISVNDDEYADKLRWMRSSYGRTGEVSVRINGNGRFSEIQAAEALSAIQCGRVKENVFSAISDEVLKVISGRVTNIQCNSSYYTSGIIGIPCSDKKVVSKVRSLFAGKATLCDMPAGEGLDDVVYLRLPVNDELRKQLLNILAA